MLFKTRGLKFSVSEEKQEASRKNPKVGFHGQDHGSIPRTPGQDPKTQTSKSLCVAHLPLLFSEYSFYSLLCGEGQSHSSWLCCSIFKPTETHSQWDTVVENGRLWILVALGLAVQHSTPPPHLSDSESSTSPTPFVLETPLPPGTSENDFGKKGLSLSGAPPGPGWLSGIENP